MTVILGYANGTNVWIGADSSAQNGDWTRLTIQERKVFRLDDRMIVAVCGRWRVAQLVQAGLILPDHPGEVNDISYLVLCFVPALQALLKQHDEVMKTDNSSTGILIGYRGVLYSMDSYFNVNAFRSQVVSDGAGGDLALGAFLALRRVVSKTSIESSIRSAIEIAAERSLAVEEPTYVEML